MENGVDSMIYTELESLKRYRGMGKYLDEAIDYLCSHSLSELKEGHYEINGDRLYLNVFDYETILEEEGFFEAHEHYADIQMTIEGEELVGVSEMSKVSIKSIDRGKDLIEVTGQPEHYMRLIPGKALIVFPEDAHMVKLAAKTPSAVRKAVIKLYLEDS